MLRTQINDALKTAMKAGDQKTRVATLRLINAAIKDRDVAARGEDRSDGATDDEILAILTKMVKQREDSAEAFDQGSRPDLAEQERTEIEIIREFLPKQMSADEIEAAVSDVLRENEAEGLKDMGKCMNALKERYTGSMDFSAASKLVKAALS